MISGYSTARFYAPVLDCSQVPPSELCGVNVTISNQMDTTVQVGFVPLSAASVPVLSGSGDRYTLYSDGGTNLGQILYLSGGGQARVHFAANKPYLEMFTEEGGPAQVRVQVESLIQWDQKGFDRLDAKYPPQLFQPKWSSFPWPTG